MFLFFNIQVIAILLTLKAPSSPNACIGDPVSLNYAKSRIPDTGIRE